MGSFFSFLSSSNSRVQVARNVILIHMIVMDDDYCTNVDVSECVKEINLQQHIQQKLMIRQTIVISQNLFQIVLREWKNIKSNTL